MLNEEDFTIIWVGDDKFHLFIKFYKPLLNLHLSFIIQYCPESA